MKRWHWLGLALLLAAIFTVGVGLGFLLPRFFGGGGSRRYLDTATVVKQVQALSELVTIQYTLEKVVVLEDVKWSEWLGTSRVLMVAHGVVKAGVDLGKVDARDIFISAKKISLVLPPAKITDAYLDDKQTQVVERTTGLLRTFDKDLEQSARAQALADIERAARHSGILKESEEKARLQLANLFHQLGFETVEFRGAPPPRPTD
jgi:hypothetical protein